jgi:hypothetical protein
LAGSLRPGEIAGIAITLILLVLVIVVVILVLVFRLKPLLLRGKLVKKLPLLRTQKVSKIKKLFFFPRNTNMKFG